MATFIEIFQFNVALPGLLKWSSSFPAADAAGYTTKPLRGKISVSPIQISISPIHISISPIHISISPIHISICWIKNRYYSGSF
jgi:hypothetical protein